MGYADESDLRTRYGQDELLLLTDVNGDGAPDASAIAAALAAADEIIDGYLAGRYALPLSPAPGILKDVACAIARARLHREGAPENVRAGHDEAISRLKDIASGRFRLQAAGAETPAAGGAPQTLGGERVMSLGNLEAFR